MVLIHTFENYYEELSVTNPFYMIVNFLGSPAAAPVFVFLLGVFIIYSSRSTSNKLLKRGFKLLIGSYLFNIVCFTVPNLINYQMTKDVSYLPEGINSYFGVDILQFAALTFIFFSIVKKFNINNKQVLLIGLIIGIINLLTHNFHTNIFIIDSVLSLFIQTGIETCYFPLFSWILYPIVGYIFGQYLIKCSDKDKFYKYLFSFSFMIFALIVLNNHLDNLHLLSKFILDGNDYYYQNFIDNIFVLSFVGFWISIFYYVQKYIKSKLVNQTINRWSKNVTSIYIVSYLLITYPSLIIVLNPNGIVYYFLTGFIIFILSDIIVYYKLNLNVFYKI